MRDRITPTIKTCTGCTACMHICPKNTIRIISDEAGFQRAEVDVNNCIDCGLCLDICHLQNEHKRENREHPLFFAAYSKEKNNVESSSSGGIFWELCKEIILCKKGVVYGAVQESVLKVSHKRAETLEDIMPMRRSKYLESELEDTYLQVKEDLQTGRIVLFSGVGCQIAGLYEYLRKSYDNLLTCEVVCHGIPSQIAYEKYLKMEEERYFPNKVKEICFRDKGLGWRKNSIKIDFENRQSIRMESKDHPLHNLYLNGINMRSACGNCRTAKLPRVADITLADFWTYNGELMEKSQDRGLSLVALNNSEGDQLFFSIMDQLNCECVTEKDALRSSRHMHLKPQNNAGQELFLDMIKKYDFSQVSEIFLRFGDIVPAEKLHQITEIDKQYIYDVLWADARQVIYVVSNDGFLEGIINLNDYAGNYARVTPSMNRDYKHAVISFAIDDEIERYRRCWEDIDQIFKTYPTINRVPVLDDSGKLCYEVRRKNTGRGGLPIIDEEEFIFLQKHERMIHNRDLILIKDYKEVDKNNSDVRYLVHSPGRAKLLGLICNTPVISIEEYRSEIHNIIPFIRLVLQGTKVLFVKRPDYLHDYPYEDDAKQRIKNGDSFVKLSEDIDKNEAILRCLLKNKYSKEYVAELRKVPPIIEKGKKFIHVDYQSNVINVVGGYRKTMYQQSNYDRTIRMYGRCGVFGYAVEDKDTMPSILQEIINCDSDKHMRVMNHGLWGADDRKILTNLNEDISDRLIDEQDIVVVYMDYIPGIKTLDKLGISICDTTEDFHSSLNSSDLFYDRPGHMTAEGYKSIADIIYRQLSQPAAESRTSIFSEELLVELLNDCVNYENGKGQGTSIKGFDHSIEVYLLNMKERLGDEFNYNGTVGAIVMNCNPFTKGHRYLIEKAKEEVDELIIFVLEEDKSYFSFEDRYQMVKSGTSDLKNVHVLPSGNFILSALTFPEYFIKEQIQDVQINPLRDIDIFGKKIAPTFNIKIRFAGTEPQDNITGQYNETMREFLPKYGIIFKEIPRVSYQDCVISASTARRFLKEGKQQELQNYVPQTTLEYLMNREGMFG